LSGYRSPFAFQAPSAFFNRPFFFCFDKLMRVGTHVAHMAFEIRFKGAAPARSVDDPEFGAYLKSPSNP
jgi:hypothetical protein